MKIQTKILFAFLLNVFFSIFEFVGGILTGSFTILSDSVHDLCDALTIGVSYLLERLAQKPANNKYTYGYKRYSLLAAFLTNAVLFVSSTVIIIHAIKRLINCSPVHYNGMLIIALVGFVINLLAVKLTHGGQSMNQKAVNLHMLEDVLGWLIALIGAIIMKVFQISWLDPLLSIIVSVYILVKVCMQLRKILKIFMLAVPNRINVDKLKMQLILLPGIVNVHHLHIWSLDENNILATVHIVAKKNKGLFNAVKNVFMKNGIDHVTISIEENDCICKNEICQLKTEDSQCACKH